MKLRELKKPGAKGVCRIHQNQEHIGVQEANTYATGLRGSVAAADKDFEQEISKKARAGWKETDRSLSRRVFFHSGNKPGKFWIVWLDDDSVGVQYGKEPRHASWWSPQSGQTKKKDFSDRAKALKEYERSIAEKLAEGYEERYARATDYSEYGKALAAQKKAAPKVERIKRPKPPAKKPPKPGEFNDSTTPPWLAKSTATAINLVPIRGSEFANTSKLPPITVGKHKLNAEQIAAILLALQHAEFGKPDEFLSALKQHATVESLDAFAWALPGEWVDAGASPKHKWAMRAIGFLGSDALAIRLTPLIRAWPGESQHPRAVLGLECLRAIGSDTALMQLNGIAVKSKFKAIQAKAREMMEAIAKEKGLSASQLEDRIVPDCDLDERGGREFDFGPRQFRFVLGPGLKPAVKFPDDSVKDDLPKPGAKDDADKAKAAVEEWKLLKKQVKEVAAIQAARLEQTMVTGRRWSVAEFDSLLVKHPLMTILIRLVLWGVYDTKGKLIALFRITEDRTFADAADKPFKLNGIDTVGIVHPLHLDDAQKSAWGELFSDYEIVPLFPQLNRPTYRFTADELRTNEIKRFGEVKIPVATLAFGLEKLGWRRGNPQDNGQVNGHAKHFPAADLSAVVILDEGFTVGYRDGWEDQKIADVYFVPGPYTVTWGRRFGRNETKTIPLKKLDPVIASEVLGDLTGLAAKGK
jgi:predicted DNA-binding WGR domain protein